MRKDTIDFFEKGIFPYEDNVFKTKGEKSEEESEENKLFEYIENESKTINYDFFEKYSNFVVPTVLAKKLYETKNKKKNSEFVELIKVKFLILVKSSKTIRTRIKNFNTEPNV